MITRIVDYYCYSEPDDDDIKEAIKIATDHNCYVRLNYIMDRIGEEKVLISSRSEVDEVRDNIKRYYTV